MESPYLKMLTAATGVNKLTENASTKSCNLFKMCLKQFEIFIKKKLEFSHTFKSMSKFQIVELNSVAVY